MPGMDGTASAALSASGVGLRVGSGRWLFRDLTLNLMPGEIVRVLGGSGSGVSSLLAVLAGVREPTRGTVRRRAPAVSFVPQHFPERLPLSPESYLAWVGRIRGMRSDVRELRIRQLVRTFELGVESSQRVDLVTGNREQLARRVAIMQALLDEPSLLVLDDPWNSTDGHLREVLGRQILELAEAGCLVIYSGFAPALQPTQYLSLTGGRLRSTEHDPLGEQPSLMRLELTGTGSELTGLAGFVSQQKHPRGGVVVTVEAGHSDELLARALQAGWSVRRVEPVQ